jgi:perosamine synthetase
MPISRGSIRHNLIEDALNVVRSIVTPRRVAKRASTVQKSALSEKISREFGFNNVVLFPYARSAFHAILKALDLPEKSEILLTPITIGPMLEVILTLGHTPVFVDIELETFCVDPVDLKAKLERKPACFLLTYLFGYVPNIEHIASMCESAGTVLIEDISHNISATYDGRALGSFGRASIYSASLLKYVDGYNGAFVGTSDKLLAESLELEVSSYRDPDPRRIASIIQTTFIWNFCLRRIPFSFLVYPLLWIIKKINPEKFEQILGARIKFKPQEKLPEYYFEDIASIQCETIEKQLSKLNKLVESRISSALIAAEVGKSVLGRTIIPDSQELQSKKRHTFWQFVIPVNNLSLARESLFQQGVETGATNLMNLSAVVGADLPRAKALKESFIFIPLHGWMTSERYKRIFISIDNSQSR